LLLPLRISCCDFEGSINRTRHIAHGIGFGGAVFTGDVTVRDGGEEPPVNLRGGIGQVGCGLGGRETEIENIGKIRCVLLRNPVARCGNPHRLQ
jgi:hypothetical protein